MNASNRGIPSGVGRIFVWGRIEAPKAPRIEAPKAPRRVGYGGCSVLSLSLSPPGEGLGGG